MSRINSALKLLVAASAASLLLGGCLSSNVDLHWGEAHETTNLANQIANPDAGQTERPGPANLDPGTAERTAETYYEIPKKSHSTGKGGPTIQIGEGGQMQL